MDESTIQLFFVSLTGQSAWLPAAYRADVHMDKIGFGIVTHTTGFHSDAQVAQSLRAVTGQSDVDGHAFCVEALFGYARGAAAQHFVGGRAPVARDDAEGAGGANPFFNDVEDVHQFGIDGFDFIGSVVSENVIYFFKGLGTILAVFIVANSQVFVGVDVV